MKTLFLVCIMIVMACGGVIAKGTDQTPLYVNGTIGDAADEARMYEIDGTIYTFPPNLKIEDQYGNALTFTALRPGANVKVIGAQTKGGVIFEKVVVFETDNNR